MTAITVTCPYCNRSDLRGKHFYLCSPCDAYVGCHKGTIEPLGRLANAELRQAKTAAHVAFDPLWRTKDRSTAFVKTRSAAYQWLADQLGIPRTECHIGMFDVERCRLVVEICRLALTAF